MTFRSTFLSPVLLRVLLSLLAGGLLAAGWPPASSFYLLFVAFVPLMLLSDLLGAERRSWLIYASLVALSLFTWNAYTTQWIYRTFFTSGVIVNTINVTVFTLPWLLYYATKSRWSRWHRYALLVSSWMSLELMHYYWGLSFPYLTLGNVLASVPSLAQWYEYTGVFGGSLWVWGANLLVYEGLREALARKAFSRPLARKVGYALLWILLPMGLSLLIFSSYEERGKPIEVVAVHTNLDCRKERKTYTAEQLINLHWDLTRPYLNDNTRYVLWPENAMNLGWMETLPAHPPVVSLQDSLQSYPHLQLITGAILYERYPVDDPTHLPPNVRYLDVDQQRVWYNTYNGALQLNADLDMRLRTKIHLTPLEETTVYPLLINFLRGFIPSLGGHFFSVWPGNQDVFRNQTHVTPVICFESFFGHTVRGFVRQGADALFVMLNEGWMDDDQQAQQFMQYASLRAIETRRSVVRTSNLGISCFMDQRGVVTQAATDNTPTALVGQVLLNHHQTIYTLAGDYLSWAAVAVMMMYTIRLLLTLIRVLINHHSMKERLPQRVA